MLLRVHPDHSVQCGKAQTRLNTKRTLNQFTHSPDKGRAPPKFGAANLEPTLAMDDEELGLLANLTTPTRCCLDLGSCHVSIASRVGRRKCDF